MDSTHALNVPLPAPSVPASPATPSAQAMLFQRLRVRLLRNSLGSVVFASSIRLGTIVVLSALIWVFLFVLAWTAYRFLQVQDQQQRMVIIDIICGFLFDLMFLILAVMLV